MGGELLPVPRQNKADTFLHISQLLQQRCQGAESMGHSSTRSQPEKTPVKDVAVDEGVDCLWPRSPSPAGHMRQADLPDCVPALHQIRLQAPQDVGFASPGSPGDQRWPLLLHHMRSNGTLV